MADDEAADSRIFAKSGQMAGYVISGIFAYAGPGFIGISGHIMDGVVSGNDHERSQVDSAYFLFRQPAKDMIQRGISLYRPHIDVGVALLLKHIIKRRVGCIGVVVASVAHQDQDFVICQ